MNILYNTHNELPEIPFTVYLNLSYSIVKYDYMAVWGRPELRKGIHDFYFRTK